MKMEQSEKNIGNSVYVVETYDDLWTGPFKGNGIRSYVYDDSSDDEHQIGCIEGTYNPSSDFLQIVYYEVSQRDPNHHEIAKYLMRDFIERAKKWQVQYVLVVPYPLAHDDSENAEKEISAGAIKEKLYKVYGQYGFELADEKMYLKF